MSQISTSEKIRLVAGRRGVTMGSVAAGTGQTRQNFSNKLKRGDFKESELTRIADFLGCDLVINFVDRSTGESI